MSTRPLLLEPSSVMAALHAHLPLTLLMDLALGPALSSEEVLEAEGLVEGEQAWWLTPAAQATPVPSLR